MLKSVLDNIACWNRKRIWYKYLVYLTIDKTDKDLIKAAYNADFLTDVQFLKLGGRHYSKLEMIGIIRSHRAIKMIMKR